MSTTQRLNGPARLLIILGLLGALALGFNSVGIGKGAMASDNHLYTDIEAWRARLSAGPLTPDMQYFINEAQTAPVGTNDVTIERSAWLIGCLYIIDLYQSDMIDSDEQTNDAGWDKDFRSEPLLCLEF